PEVPGPLDDPGLEELPGEPELDSADPEPEDPEALEWEDPEPDEPLECEDPDPEDPEPDEPLE
ncbi:MAG: hypothetical protein JOZ33_18895, partial [Acidobacteriaceae bacterium]|nr:hypothetical protein [Acidobacteriaceae bacterium]